MLASLVDVDTGRVSIQKAVYGSAYGVLVDPLTGNPYSSINPLPVASGGSTNTSVVTNYVCISQFTDTAGVVDVNDQLVNIQIYDVFGALVVSIWNDITASFTLDAAPPSGTVDIYIPGGGATAANQVLEINELTTISGQLPTTLGSKVTASSLSVNVASDQVVPVSASALPLPTGAATAANQATEIASLATIATKTTALVTQLPAALGKTTQAGSLSVTLASNDVVTTTVTASFTYTSNSASFTGTNIGDLVARYSVLNSATVPPALISETWYNITQGTAISAPASYSYVTEGGTSVTPVLPQRSVVNYTETNVTGTVAAGCTQVSFANVGSADAVVQGQTLPIGAAVSYEAPSGGSIGSVSYDATGTTLLIATLQ